MFRRAVPIGVVNGMPEVEEMFSARVLVKTFLQYFVVMEQNRFLSEDATTDEMIWGLIDCGWRFDSQGNSASTTSGKLASLRYFHRMEAR